MRAPRRVPASPPVPEACVLCGHGVGSRAATWRRHMGKLVEYLDRIEKLKGETRPRNSSRNRVSAALT